MLAFGSMRRLTSKTARANDARDPAWLGTIEHGAGDPAPEGRIVRLGRLTALLLGSELRYVQLGSRELLRRIHVAVRDPAWGTLPQVITRADINQRSGHLGAAFDLTHAANGLAFDCTVEISADAAGLTYSMAGAFRIDSSFNRIGLCVMLPSSCAGRPYTASGPAGSISGTLPHLVAPQRVEGESILALFPAFDQLHLGLGPNLGIDLGLTGDVFEMEDQRNWTDDSFKIYSPPLALPRPRTVRAGDRIAQAMSLRVRPLDE
jgi:D-apionolactonase